MDDSSMNAELDMLNNMAIRQRKYIKELENASIRIQNKVYGICMISGDLIDKRRLTAVPTTTKSLAAKKAMSALKPQRRAEATTRKKKRNTITKTPSRNRARISKPALPLEEEGGLLFNISPPPPVEELPLDQRPSPEELE
jgi:RNA polymerase-binding transcription factor DksA